jgi:hypothetical protein
MLIQMLNACTGNFIYFLNFGFLYTPLFTLFKFILG